jgi:hypothetical protein
MQSATPMQTPCLLGPTDYILKGQIKKMKNMGAPTDFAVSLLILGVNKFNQLEPLFRQTLLLSIIMLILLRANIVLNRTIFS